MVSWANSLHLERIYINILFFNINFPFLFLKIDAKGIHYYLVYKASITLITNQKKRLYQRSTDHEYVRKNPQQNIKKLIPTIYKRIIYHA